MGLKLKVADVDKKATDLYKTNSCGARAYITEFSKTQGNMTVDRWRRLGEYLLVKYMDGNIKNEKDGHFVNNGYSDAQSAFPQQPFYPQEFYREILKDKDKADVLRMRTLPGEKPETK